MVSARSDKEYIPDMPAYAELGERYEFIRELGRGGMAIVHLARHRVSGELVAIKAIRRKFREDKESLARFAREARTIVTLDHPNIIRTRAVEFAGEQALAIVMELMKGETLRETLRNGGALSFERAREILRDIALALEHAHSRGLVHRDVKPENIFLGETTGRAYLSDFGIARRADDDQEITLSGAAVGTPAYMSPEQIEGAPLDARSDIYGLGLVGWEMTAGVRPWQHETLFGVIYRQCTEELPRLNTFRPDIPRSLLFAVEGALLKHADTRWQNAAEFLAELLREDNEPVALARSPAPASPYSRGSFAILRDGTVRPSAGAVHPRRRGPDAPSLAQRAGSERSAKKDAGPGRLAEEDPTADAFAPPFPPWDVSSPGHEPLPRRGWAGRLAAAPLAIVAALTITLAGTLDDQKPAEPADRADTLFASVTDNGLIRWGDTADATSAGARGGRGWPFARRTRAPAPATRADSLAACESAVAMNQRICLTALLRDTERVVDLAFRERLANLWIEQGHRAAGAEPQALQELGVEQRAWVAERDVECGRRVPESAGTLWARRRFQCLSELSRDRVEELAIQGERIDVGNHPGRGD